MTDGGVSDTFCEFPRPDIGKDDTWNSIGSMNTQVCLANGCPRDDTCETWADIVNDAPCRSTNQPCRDSTLTPLKYQYWAGREVPGGIISAHTGIATYQDCLNICDADTNCKAASYEPAG